MSFFSSVRLPNWLIMWGLPLNLGKANKISGGEVVKVDITRGLTRRTS